MLCFKCYSSREALHHLSHTFFDIGKDSQSDDGYRETDDIDPHERLRNELPVEPIEVSSSLDAEGGSFISEEIDNE